MSKSILSLATYRRPQFSALLALTAFACVGLGQAAAQVRNVNGFTVFTPPSTGGEAAAVDFVKAKAFTMPQTNLPANTTQAMITALTSTPAFANPGSSPGAQGNGAASPVFLGTPEASAEGGFAPEDFGTNNHAFSTARADLNGLATNRAYPYSAAGKLFFNISGSSFICSASMIKRGIVVTAAHCVANYGRSQFYSNWQFVPGYRSGTAPFGVWSVAQAWIKTAYFNGTDGCFQFGVICPDDVAILILRPNAVGAYAGSFTGWLGYGWNGYGFTGSQTHITQLGYPAGLDSAGMMERNDSAGYINTTYSRNTIIGSNMNGGSSGGPWIVNFGMSPALTGESNGSSAGSNIVVGVTSWGYISNSPKEQGAAPFTSNNIVSLVNSACSSIPAACK